MPVKQYHYHVFTTDDKQSGNPALVITDFYGDKDHMQVIARDSGSPATIFMLTGKKFPLLRIFYPDMEASLCVHGALAAAKFLFDHYSEKTSLYCENNANELYCFSKDKNDVIQMKLSKQQPPIVTLDENTMSTLLNLDSAQRICKTLPCRVESVGSPKWLIPLVSKEVLSTLQPNVDAIKAWSIKHRVNGLYVYSEEHDHIIARNFNPKTGILEDSGTGVAAGALSLALKKNLRIAQGEFIQQPSEIFTTYKNDREIFVGGRIRCY